MVLRGERTGIDKKFFELCSKVVVTEGLKLYDMDYLPGSLELRLYIYNPETNTAVIEDCVKIDHALTPYFESEQWMPQEISLEVSSPGVFRTLKTVEHFKMAEGEKVAMVLKGKLEKDAHPEAPKSILNDKKIMAQLKAASEDGVKLEEEGYEFELKYEEIKKANIEKDL